MNKKWIFLGIIALAAIAFFFVRTPISPVAPNLTNVTNVTNITTPSGATFGDLITINFALYLENGTVADTNDPALAEQHKVSNYVKGPYMFILGQSGKVPGFDEALLGMQVGDHRETIIEPSEKEVILNISKVKQLKRFITVIRYQKFPRTTYEEFFKKPPIIGDVVRNDKLAFRYQVVNMSNETVLATMVLKEGEEYTLPNTEWKSKVARVSKDDALFFQSPEENQTTETPFGPAVITLTPSAIIITMQPELNRIFNKSIELKEGFSIPQTFHITEVRDKDFTIKRYNVLVEKRLRLVADLIERVEGVKKVKTDKPLITEVNSKIEN